MNVKEAISQARGYLGMVFADENISEVRLEEVAFDRTEGSWLVTFGLLRPGQRMQQGPISDLMGPPPLKRSYKVVRIPNDENDVPSIRIRELGEE